MKTQELKIRLYFIAIKGMKTARRNNPFWTRAEATAAIVAAFKTL